MIDTGSVWEMISNIPIGHIISFGAVALSIILAVYKAISKLYGLFKKYKAMQEEDEYHKKLIKEHDQILEKMDKSLDEIKHSLEEQRDVNLKQLRFTLVHACDDAIADGFISAGKLKSIEEMFEEYVEVFHANGYVKVLVGKVRKLPVRGKLDE